MLGFIGISQFLKNLNLIRKKELNMKESLYKLAGNLEEELQALEQPATHQMMPTEWPDYDCPFPNAE